MQEIKKLKDIENLFGCGVAFNYLLEQEVCSRG